MVSLERKLLAFAIAWDVIFTAAAPFADMGYHSTFGNLAFASMDYRAVMYMHGLLIAYVATLALLICELFKIKNYGVKGHARKIVRYSALIGILLGGIGGIINFGYIGTSGFGVVGDLPTWIQIISFLFMDEIAIALLYFLLTAPKAAGVRYRNAGLPYYLLTLSVASAFLAAVMGHIGGFVIQYGGLPGPFNAYISWLGLTASEFAANNVGSHSHDMAVALMAGIIALVAQHFGYSKLGKKARLTMRTGLAISIVGVVLMTSIYVAAGLYNYSIPTLFTSGPNGVNGVAFDDILTGIVGFGAVFVIAALAGPWYKKIYGSNPTRAAILTTWVIAILTVPVLGYWIELHESFYGALGSIPGAPGAASDSTYLSFHQDLAFFAMPALAAAILAMDYYMKSEGKKLIISLSAIGGSWLSFVGGTTYTFISPEGINAYAIVGYAGAVLIALSALAVALYLAGILGEDARLKPEKNKSMKV